jgi:sulfite reductase (NADPH) flavoprotein alpha-component
MAGGGSMDGALDAQDVTPEPIPARQVLRRVELANAALGHENQGFLSGASGFLPRRPPLLHLPATHRAWDEAAARLPEWWRTATVRQALAELPRLGASEAELGQAFVWRASTILSMLAHAWVRSEIEPAPGLPSPLQEPWAEISRRLARPEPFLAYADLILYNWRLRDPYRPDPMRVDNLELLVPTVDNQEERVFYLAQVEILAQCAPMIEAVVRAQEATVRDDGDALARELLLILERLRHVTEVSLLKIDPNPLAATYVDPVVWANTVAPFAVPIKQGTAGPSGTSAPMFHLLDVFLGRRDYATLLGQEMEHLRASFSPDVREFLQAVAQIQVRAYVERRGDPLLRGLFQAVFDAYAGDRGYLGVHRRKVYGFLEVAFKVGRQVTIGGFSGTFKDRPWKTVDAELENTRIERYTGLAVHPYYARLARRSTTAAGGSVRQIGLEIARSGITYRPGDRVGVLPENTVELVQRTLQALHATGSERVPLTRAWRAALRFRVC